ARLIGRGVGSCFFFSSRRRHTRFSRDWSSDVCSSDLTERTGEVEMGQFELHERLQQDTLEVTRLSLCRVLLMNNRHFPWLILVQIGRASCRERVELAVVAVGVKWKAERATTSSVRRVG